VIKKKIRVILGAHTYFDKSLCTKTTVSCMSKNCNHCVTDQILTTIIKEMEEVEVENPYYMLYGCSRQYNEWNEAVQATKDAIKVKACT